jgi:hypothetical protein
LVSSRQTAAGQVATARRDEVAQAWPRAASGLEQDRAAVVARDALQALAALATGPREEALEAPARPCHRGCRNGREDRR